MPSGEIDRLSADIMTVYRGLVERVKKIKSDPQSGNSMNASQVGRTDRRLKATIQKYQTLEASFRKESQAAAERQYRIVRPEATDAEVREAVSDPNAPIFQQAVCFFRVPSPKNHMLTSPTAPLFRPPRPSQQHPPQRQGAPRGDPAH